jgi:hypothetical protein
MWVAVYGVLEGWPIVLIRKPTKNAF